MAWLERLWRRFNLSSWSRCAARILHLCFWSSSWSSRLPSCICRIWLGKEMRECNHEIPLIIAINHGLNVNQRHLLMNYNSVFVLNWEIRFNYDQELRVDHHIPDAHLLVHALITKNEFHVYRWQLVRLSARPCVDYSGLSRYWIHILFVFDSVVYLWFYQ